MKKALIAAAATLAIGSAHAEWVAKTMNTQGGEIVLTDKQLQCGKNAHAAYTHTSSGASNWGCYYIADGKVFMSWRNGAGTRIYDFDSGWKINQAWLSRVDS